MNHVVIYYLIAIYTKHEESGYQKNKQMNINVLSKPVFNNLMREHKINDDTVENYKDVFFISINDTKTSPYYKESWFKRDHDNVKVLYFDDVESEGETSPTNSGKCKPFTEKMAEDLCNFINKNLGSGQAIIHCEAGISRSGAVGSFICDMSKSNFPKFLRDNPQISPNGRVLRMLNKCKRADISLNEK